MSCLESLNLICKHPSARKTFFVDLSFMPDGVTAVSATATTEDEELEIVAVEVLDEDMDVDATSDCAGVELESGRALLIILSGGVESDDEVIVTVEWEQSDNDSDARDLRLLVG